MPRSLGKEPMVLEDDRDVLEVQVDLTVNPEIQEVIIEDPKVNRPPNRLSYEDMVQERQVICKEIDDIKLQIAKIKKDLKENAAKYTEDEAFDKREEKARLRGRIKELSKELDKYDLDIYKKAFYVLEHGDPVDYIIRVYHKWHLGDTSLGKVLLLSIANTVITNTKGIQPKGSGTSGKGKTDAFEAIYKLISDEPYKFRGTVSAKSLYYKPDMIDGMIIFSDDVQMSDDLEGTLKRSMGSFQENSSHATLIKQVYKETQLPKRITWWLTSVDTNYSDELINRLFDLSVDESSKLDEEVADKIFADTVPGEDNLPTEEEIKICQTIIHIIKRQLFTVKIPFGKSIEWNVPGDRRNPSRFVALIMGFAVFRHMQREETEEGFTLAAMEDFLDAKELYEEGKANQISKLTDAELKLVRWMVTQNRPLSVNDIISGYEKLVEYEEGKYTTVKVEGYKKPNGDMYTYYAISKMIVGDKKHSKNGLDAKVPGITIKNDNGVTKYYISEFNEFKGEAVTLKEVNQLSGSDKAVAVEG